MKDELVSLYIDAFPEDGEEYARYFVSKAHTEDIVTYSADGINVTNVAYIVPKTATLDENIIPISYLSAVSTRSDMRGRGLIKKVIVEALNKIYKRKVPLVALYPFDFNYYLKFDFISASQSGKSVIIGKKDYFVRPVEVSDIDVLIDIYNAYARSFSFRQAVDRDYFLELISENRIIQGEFNLIFDESGEAQAYAVVEGNTVTKYAYRDRRFIDECAWLSGKSYNDFTCKKDPYIQMRIANLLELLRLDIYESDIDLEMCVKDGLISENNGVYRVRKVCNEVCVMKTYDDIDEHAITIAELLASYIKGNSPFKKPSVMFMDKY